MKETIVDIALVELEFPQIPNTDYGPLPSRYRVQIDFATEADARKLLNILMSSGVMQEPLNS